MKKLFTAASAVLLGIAGAYGQLVEVVSTTPVPLDANTLVDQAVLSPDGHTAVISQLNANGLSAVDLAKGSIRHLTDNGSALDLAFSADGATAYFRKTTTGTDRLRKTALAAVDIATAREKQLTAPSRDFALTSAPVRASLRGKTLAGAPAPTVGIHRGHLVLTLGGNTTYLDPQGKGSYLWPSISPDGTRILYYKAGQGCFNCALDGTDIHALGYLHGPVWYGNDIIVGFRDHDNGTVTTQSTIVAISADGLTEQTLTHDNIIAVNPSADHNNARIAFSTTEGKMYIINLKK